MLKITPGVIALKLLRHVCETSKGELPVSCCCFPQWTLMWGFFLVSTTMVVLGVEHIYVFNSEFSLFLVGIFFCHCNVNLGCVLCTCSPGALGWPKLLKYLGWPQFMPFVRNFNL